MRRSYLTRWLFGKPLDPFAQNVRQHMALITFFAWIGLGADGISSSAYGPEEAFFALGQHTELGVFLALATGITVFLIALAYMQVIELFPNGGGGYRVASTLLGARAGLVAGSALIIDYVLTIAISVASAVDSFFSVLPHGFQPYKIYTEIILVLLLTQLNLRGMKESIKILMPIFLGFMVSYVGLIVYGILVHAEGLGAIMPDAITDANVMADEMGWFAVLALFFKAFSMGGGTYTGLEAVSSSMHNLAAPRVRTGKLTMICIATSLAFMATGIIMLYLLWDVERVAGETMNATAFGKITADWAIAGVNISQPLVLVVMLLTAGLLFVAANTGFIAGPAVLANLAVDRWMPHMFSALSSRLVTKNGVVMMGVAAIAALLITHGEVHVLVVLYSINVFLTFTLSLAGVTRYRW
jgi:amino acid transporter